MDLSKVVNVLRRFAPIELAEAWDNVGLLLEPTRCLVSKVLLTNDLTENVLDEAISQKVNLIISYHPPIFSSFKRLTQNNWKSRIIIRCLENNIALYSPHTSWDHVQGGVNDWLSKAFLFNTSKVAYIAPINPPPSVVDAGIGRSLTLEKEIALEEAVRLIKQHTGVPTVRIAAPKEKKLIKTIDLCAGSGSSVFKMAKRRSDLLLTGEMSHHDVLDAIHGGSYVVLCEHSNTERGFLHDFKDILTSLEPRLTVTVSEGDEDPLKSS